MSVLLILLTILLSTYIFSSLLYQFQIKEYRFDRLIVAFRENGLMYYIIPKKILYPKISLRNLAITGLVVSAWVITYFYLNYLYLPAVTITVVVLGVIVSALFPYIRKKMLVKSAFLLRKKSNAIFIGVTGSFGKSTVKEFLYELLSIKFKVSKTIENYNTAMGVSISLLKDLKEDTDIFIAEMGAYKLGEIKEICNFIKPTYAVISGLSNQHLSLFGSKQNLIKAKSELFDSLPKGSQVFLNADCEGCNVVYDRYKNHLKIQLYSENSNNADLYLSKYFQKGESTVAEIVYKKKLLKIESKLIGKHNYLNLLPAIGLALELDVSANEIAKRIALLKNSFGKLSTHGRYIYDGYSSNCYGFLAALDVLNMYHGPKVVISKGIIELGQDKKQSYELILKKLEEVEAILITSDILFSKLNKSNVKILSSEKSMLNFINSLGKDHTVLIEGRFSANFINKLGIRK